MNMYDEKTKGLLFGQVVFPAMNAARVSRFASAYINKGFDVSRTIESDVAPTT